MRRLAELVLRHRLIVVVAWALIAVAGAMVASTVSDRMTVNFSLPGQPGDTAANKIIAAYHNGGNTTPLLVTVTMPQGQTITGNEAEVAQAFASVGSVGVPLRVVDEANTGDKAFRTSDDRTAYAMVFYPFPQSFTDVIPTKLVQEAVQGAAPSGAVVGVTGMDAARDRRRVRRQRRPHRDAARGARRPRGAAVRVRLGPRVHAARWSRPSRS